MVNEEFSNAESVIAGMAPYVAEHSLIGSAMYLPSADCNDVDVLVLVAGCDYIEPITQLVRDGFTACGEQYECATGTWGAVRRDKLNLIITHDKTFYNEYRRAMEVCKALHITDKRDRIAVCKIVRDHMSADDALLAAYGAAKPSDAAIPDCGEAGHDDGCCGNLRCLPSRNAGVPVTVPVNRPASLAEAQHAMEIGACLPNGVMFDAFSNPRKRYVRVTFDGSHLILSVAEAEQWKREAEASAALVGQTDPHEYSDVYLSKGEADALPEFDGF